MSMSMPRSSTQHSGGKGASGPSGSWSRPVRAGAEVEEYEKERGAVTPLSPNQSRVKVYAKTVRSSRVNVLVLLRSGPHQSNPRPRT
jgi:hypothetical protein